MSLLIALLLAVPLVHATYITTCGDLIGCGSVCGMTFDPDIAAPSEGLFGTGCTCGGDGSMTQKCTYGGQAVSVCNAGNPGCSTACNQQICISMNGNQATATIMSACPRHHPINVAQCCLFQNDAYCTCIIQDTLDLEAQPYDQLGGANGFSSGAVWGRCGSQLASLGIDVKSERATKLVQPFLVNGTFCPSLTTPATLRANPLACEGLSVRECETTEGCTACVSSDGRVASQCYTRREADVPMHIMAVEHGAGALKCGKVRDKSIVGKNVSC